MEALYERRNGSREGIEEYVATLDERDRTRRHERIMESRVEDAEGYAPFELARLDGEMINSADFEGKIAVLHFWGTWCGPCVVELPEYQEFDERYREDPEVHVFSISNDETNEIIEDFLAKNNYDFTVLVDDGYSERASVRAWPTTWFVDRNGYVQFEAVGTALRLDEEFSWRVERHHRQRHVDDGSHGARRRHRQLHLRRLGSRPVRARMSRSGHCGHGNVDRVRGIRVGGLRTAG